MPLTELLERLLRLKKMSDNVEFCATMDAAYDCALALLQFHLYGDCNTCEQKGRCRWEPEFGAQVRNNCAHYTGPEKREPPRPKAKNALRIAFEQGDD